MHDIKLISEVFEKHLHQSVCSVYKYENVTNNSVYRIETNSKPYIFKIYKSSWPEEGKLLLVDNLLNKHGIPHANIFAYSRDDSYFPHGYLIEECLPGITADRLDLSNDETLDLFRKLGSLVSRVHKIKLKGYGYTGNGIAQWSTFSEFMYDSIEDSKNNLIALQLTDDDELEELGQEIWKRLKVCDKYPPVLCHTDLSTKNIIVNDDDITLIDWDDVYSLCWMDDIGCLTLWMKRQYGIDTAKIYRKAFLDNYETEYDINDFYDVEDALHVRHGLDALNYFVGTSLYDTIKVLLKESLEKCGMRVLRCLL